MTQIKRILKILSKKGSEGMNSYQYRMEFIQLPARIWDLKQFGHQIIEKTNPDRSVNYILTSEATKPIPPEYIFIGNKAIKKEDYQKQGVLL